MIGLDYVDRKGGGVCRGTSGAKSRSGIPWTMAGVLYSALPEGEIFGHLPLLCRDGGAGGPGCLAAGRGQNHATVPVLGVRIKKGAFWYYFEPNSAPGPFVVRRISPTPCQPVRFREDNGWLVRFYYYEKRISVEVFHAVSDGGGALVFFKTLLAVYLRELGYSIPNTHGILDVAEEPRRAEREDAYGRYATVRPRREKRGEKGPTRTTVRQSPSIPSTSPWASARWPG